MDTSVSKIYGQQQAYSFNGQVDSSLHHSLFVFNTFGDLVRAMPRRGNRHSAKFWWRVLSQMIASYRRTALARLFQGYAAFTYPKLMKLLENENTSPWPSGITRTRAPVIKCSCG
jgi:Transposase DDE domain group 1